MRTTEAPEESGAEHMGRSWCLKMQAIVDSLLDGRPQQKMWLKSMGDAMQRLGTMSMRLRRRVMDPTLRKDKIPLNALTGLTKAWQHLESPLQQLRMFGSYRAQHSARIDATLLQLAGILRNLSSSHGCVSEGFRLRYSAKSCV